MYWREIYITSKSIRYSSTLPNLRGPTQWKANSRSRKRSVHVLQCRIFPFELSDGTSNVSSPPSMPLSCPLPACSFGFPCRFLHVPNFLKNSSSQVPPETLVLSPLFLSSTLDATMPSAINRGPGYNLDHTRRPSSPPKPSSVRDSGPSTCVNVTRTFHQNHSVEMEHCEGNMEGGRPSELTLLATLPSQGCSRKDLIRLIRSKIRDTRQTQQFTITAPQSGISPSSSMIRHVRRVPKWEQNSSSVSTGASD